MKWQENQWMSCNTCYQTVLVNPIGVCLGCQKGFIGPFSKDSFYMQRGGNAANQRKESKDERGSLKKYQG